MSSPPADEGRDVRRQVVELGLLFGAMYFVQGIGEPTEGLVGQPVRSLLRGRGLSPGEIATFAALLSLPWSLKPLFGLLTDFVPIFGLRRRSYLLAANAVAAVGLVGLSVSSARELPTAALFAALLGPAVGIAFADVVIDAVMIERGQPLGMTGRFQSIQWSAIYGATILTGWLGGRLAADGRQELGFLICGLATAGTFALTWRYVRETPDRDRPAGLGDAARALWRTARSPLVLSVGGFLFLWSFNPFATDVLYLHMTTAMGFDEGFYGVTASILAVGAVVGSVAYGFYCRRVPVGALVHLSIALGVLATLGYLAMDGKASAIAVSLFVGFAYMTATLIQLDLAARACPPEVAGTVFSLLMAVSNLAVSLSTAVGGHLYGYWSESRDADFAFRSLVAVGATLTAGCWLLIPLLRRQTRSWDRRTALEPTGDSPDLPA